MFLRLFSITLLATLLIWPATLNAQTSQSASFTLSVTIPERAEAPVSTIETVSTSIEKITLPISTSPVQYQPMIRNYETVLLASYVVD